jgi:hypothetical protein
MKDKLGQELQTGDYVAYAGRHSSSLWLKIGKIVKIEVRRAQPVAILWAVEEYIDGSFERQLQKSQVSNSHLMIKLFDMQVPEAIRTILEPLSYGTPNETWSRKMYQDFAAHMPKPRDICACREWPEYGDACLYNKGHDGPHDWEVGKENK